MELFTAIENLPRLKSVKIELMQLAVDAPELIQNFRPVLFFLNLMALTRSSFGPSQRSQGRFLSVWTTMSWTTRRMSI